PIISSITSSSIHHSTLALHDALPIYLSPPRWVDRPVWLRLRARTQVEPAPSGQRRFLRLDVERLYLGRTRLPAVAHRLLLSPMALKLLLWPLPAGIDDIRVERQQVVIRGGG